MKSVEIITINWKAVYMDPERKKKEFCFKQNIETRNKHEKPRSCWVN